MLLVILLALLSILFGIALSIFLGHPSPLSEWLPDSASMLGIVFALVASSACGGVFWILHEWFTSSGEQRRKNNHR